MKFFKSHFEFTPKQRNGIFLLVILIASLQVLYVLMRESVMGENDIEVVDANLLREYDSLKKIAELNQQPKLYPFNPNYITDYKGYKLGMSTDEIDKLLAFRNQNKWINSTKQFQEVTGVSKAFMDSISPFFKFPEWVTNKQVYTKKNYYDTLPKPFEEKIDLNVATAAQLKKIRGIGEALSKRILDYRSNFEGGFHADVELQEVYGLRPEVIEKVMHRFTVKTPRFVETLNVNIATADELVNIKYLDYENVHYLIEERTLREGFKSLDELTKVKGIPQNKLEIIKLYLKTY
ncbi:MAG: competence protein ComEA [Bacteroidetes bacterium MedPE-SWsnd-G2]|nr:MAG: competence protein ComEA [Bacteroidetes bacterium MedPE-SWsnd-G2]